MIAKLLRFALHQRFVMIVLSFGLIAMGVFSFRQLKMEAYPDISDTQAVVITQYPGHAAEEVEQQVTVPIERALNGVPSVIARRSRTIFGLSVVELTFAYGTDDYFARAVVLEMHRLVSMDTSGLDALSHLHRALKKRGIGLVLAHVNEQPLSLMRRAGFADILGEDGIVPTVVGAFDDQPSR